MGGLHIAAKLCSKFIISQTYGVNCILICGSFIQFWIRNSIALYKSQKSSGDSNRDILNLIQPVVIKRKIIFQVRALKSYHK